VISLHHFNTVEECIVENKKRENMFPYFLEKPCDTWLHLDVSAVMERKLVNVLALLQGLAIQAPCFHSTHSTHLRVTSWGVSVTDVTWTLVSFAAVFLDVTQRGNVASRDINYENLSTQWLSTVLLRTYPTGQSKSIKTGKFLPPFQAGWSQNWTRKT